MPRNACPLQDKHLAVPAERPGRRGRGANEADDRRPREEAADHGSRLLLAVATDLSLDDTVLDLDDYIN